MMNKHYIDTSDSQRAKDQHPVEVHSLICTFVYSLSYHMTIFMLRPKQITFQELSHFSPKCNKRYYSLNPVSKKPLLRVRCHHTGVEIKLNHLEGYKQFCEK